MPKPKDTRIGELPPQNIFVLNPCMAERFVRDRNCRQPTRLREPLRLLTLAARGPFCTITATPMTLPAPHDQGGAFWQTDPAS